MKRVSQLVFVDHTSVLLGFRQNVEFENLRWGFPGGRVEANESFLDAAVRESKEELGVSPKNISLLFTLEDRYGYEHAFFRCSAWDGELSNQEPHLCREIQWYSIKHLPIDCSPITYVAVDKILNTIRGIDAL